MPLFACEASFDYVRPLFLMKPPDAEADGPLMWERAVRRVKLAGVIVLGVATLGLAGRFLLHSADQSDFLPHGTCYLWDPKIVWLHVISDGLITLSYLCIPIGLIYLVRQRRDVPFNWIFWMFGAFIVGCGITHFMEIWTIWHASYLLAGIIKAGTAVISVATAVMMIYLIPRAIALPSPAAVEELQRAEAALSESQGRLNAIIQSAMDAIIAADEDQTVLIFNAAAEKMFGYSAAEAVGLRIEQLIPERFRPTNGSDVRNFSETGTNSRAVGMLGAVWGLRSNGEEFPLEASISQVETAGKKFFTVILRDITERKQAEEARERLAAVVDSSDDAIIVKTLQGVIVAWNSSAERLFGYFAAEAIGQSMMMLFPADRFSEEKDILLRVAAGESVKHYDTVRVRKDLSRIKVSVTVSPLRDREGNIVGASTIARDITERLRADARSSQLAAIVESSADAIFSVDSALNVLTWNRGAERMFGFSEAETLGNPIRIIPPDREQEVQAILREVWQGRRRACDTQRLRKDGSLVDVSLIVSPIHDPSGRVRGASLIARDIGERKRAEQALRESEERFQAMANGIQQLAWMAHADGNIFWYNQRWYDYTGTTLEQMQGWGWQSVHDPAVLPSVMDRWKGSIAAGEPFDMEFPLRGADGVFRMFLTRIMPVKAESGTVQRWFGTNTDISERQQSEQSLARLAEEVLRSQRDLEAQKLMLQCTLDSMDEGLIAADENYKFTLWNKAAEKMVGYGPLDLSFQKWSEAYGAYRSDGVTVLPADESPLVRAVRGETCSAEILLRNGKTAGDVWVEIAGAPIRDGQGIPHGGVVAMRDITQRKAIEREVEKLNANLEEHVAELARSNRELEQFAYVASHDLQEPLRMVASYTQLFAERYRGHIDETADKFIGYATEGAQRMQVLIEDILAFSRVGRPGVVCEKVDCNSVMESVAQSLEAVMQKSGALLHYEALPEVWADRPQVAQVFQNLIGNAIKFRKEAPPEILVRVEASSSGWLFSVRDNGIGIAPEYADNIFVVFQRLHARTEYTGNGIGLAICKKIVEYYGGRIWVESQPGSGSTFKFTLPAVASQADARRHELIGAQS